MELTIGFGVEGSHPIECIISLDKNIYSLKDTGLEWFEKIKEGLEAIGFVKFQLYPCVWYRGDMVLLFY